LGTHNKDCGRRETNNSNTAFVVLILFILMAIIVGGRFF
jgi:hypothetical protein